MVTQVRIQKAENAIYSRGYGADRVPVTPVSPISLADFVEFTSPIRIENWQRLICDRLERLKDERGQRLLIHGPPQFGKSIIISQRFPCWMLGVKPGSRVRLACYNLSHAIRFAKVNLEIMRSAEFKKVFPSTEARVPNLCPSEEWSTVARARLLDANPSFKALGLGTGFTGLGVDTLVVDDPYKNAQEARSEVINEGIWDWWKDVVVPRLNPSTNVVVMFHRWTEDDFAGRLLEQGGWEHLRFAAIADGDDKWPDPMGRKLGELLSPRYSQEYLEDIQVKQGSTFQALYQGRPSPPGGDMFKRAWFKIVRGSPDSARRVRYWDKAGAAPGKGDFTVGLLMARTPDGFVIEDVVRGQWTANERDLIIVQTAHLDRQKYGNVKIFIEQPPGLAKESTDAVIAKLAGFSAHADRVTKDKIERAEPAASQAEAGNISILEGDWMGPFLDEVCAFPNGKHDDQVDGLSGAFNMLAEYVAPYVSQSTVYTGASLIPDASNRRSLF